MTIFAQVFLFQVKKNNISTELRQQWPIHLRQHKPAIYSNNKNIMENGYEENNPFYLPLIDSLIDIKKSAE